MSFVNISFLFFKWTIPGLFPNLFSVFPNKQYNFNNKNMRNHICLAYGAGICIHNLWNISNNLTKARKYFVNLEMINEV